MAATKQAGKSRGLDLTAHEAPEIRTTGQGLPIDFHAPQLSMRQRLLPLSGPAPVGKGLVGLGGGSSGGVEVRPYPGGESWTEVALLDVIRFDLEGLT